MTFCFPVRNFGVHLKARRRQPKNQLLRIYGGDSFSLVEKSSGIIGDRMFDNVRVLDNTKGQLIDFDAMLDAHEDKYPTPENNWGSAKHCKSVDYCFDILPDGFLLIDSDIIVHNDVSPLFDSSCAWVGQVQMLQSRFGTLPRVLPFLCYINVPMCREHGIRYNNDDKMLRSATGNRMRHTTQAAGS